MLFPALKDSHLPQHTGFLIKIQTLLSKRVLWDAQEGYDHSYAFISTFVDDHLQMHAKALKA